MNRLPTVKQLHHLVALAEARHFGRAARRAGVTQSTLSASIAELEQILGGPVADRSGRQINLTPLGEQVVARARKILLELQELTEGAQAEAQPLAGDLRLGVIPTISPYMLPRLLPGLRARYAKLKLYLQEDLTDRLIAQLEAGALDLLLLALPCPQQGMQVKVLMEDPFLVAMPRDHPLAKLKKIDAAQVKREKLLVLQDGHCLREHALAACGLKSSAADETYAATSLSTLVQMVDNGLGITLLPEMAVRSGILEGTGLVTRKVAEADANRAIALMWRKGSAREDEFLLLAQQLGRLLGKR